MRRTLLIAKSMGVRVMGLSAKPSARHQGAFKQQTQDDKLKLACQMTFTCQTFTNTTK